MTDYNPNPADDASDSPRENDIETAPPAKSTGDVFHATYTDGESPSVAVISAVAAVKGVAPAELKCLYDHVDPEALDTLIDEPVVIGGEGTIGIEFQYSGYYVTVRNDGNLTLTEQAE
jgi:hypothetical protein